MTEHSGDPEFNAFLRDSWRETSMERDRSLLTLSTGGVGLLTTLLTFREKVTLIELSMYVGAAVCFAVAIGCSLAIFKRNAVHLEQLIRGEKGKTPELRRLDLILIISFSIGIALTAVVAGYIGYSRIH